MGKRDDVAAKYPGSIPDPEFHRKLFADDFIEAPSWDELLNGQFSDRED